MFAGQRIVIGDESRPRRFTDIVMHHDRLDQPLRWRKPRRIFVNSLSDLFHEDVPERFIADVFGVMAAAHWHTFQILTKRPGRLGILGRRDGGVRADFLDRVEECCALYSHHDFDWPLPNVWLGVSVEDQATADERIPLLLQPPAAVRFLSCEPLLGPLNLAELRPWHTAGIFNALRGFAIPQLGTTNPQFGPRIDWVIAGGESGPNARPMHPDWVRSLRDQCAAAGVPFFFKQWGEWAPRIRNDGRASLPMSRVGKKAAGRLLDGREHSEYPA